MLKAGDIIERKDGHHVTRGCVISNDRDGLFIMATTGWNFHIPSNHIRVLTETDDGKLYTDVKRKSERHLARFLKG